MIDRLGQGLSTVWDTLTSTPLGLPALVLFVVVVFLATNGRAR